MKRFLLTFLVVAVSVLLVSCKNAVNLEMYLSEIRSVVYTYSGDNYSLSVYGEEKESPYISDGFVGQLKTYVTVKIENYKTPLDNASVTVNFNEKSVSGKFDYSPLSGKFIAEIETDGLPTDSEIGLIIASGGNEETFTLSKFSKEGQIDYKTALNSVSYEKNDEIKKMLNGNGDSIEVRVRVLTEGESVYYYVAVIGKDEKSLTCLVDGASGKILAERKT